MASVRVVVAGYYGFGNLGDEVLLGVTLDWLRGFEGVEPQVLSANPMETGARHGVSALNRWNPVTVFGALRGAKALVLGGGGLLQDATSARSLSYYLGLLRLARWLKVPAFLLGQGLGPLSERGEALAAHELRQVAYLSVRDDDSLARARAWGAPEARWAPDLALSIAPKLEPSDSARPVLGLALVAPPAPQREAVLDALAEGIQRVRAVHGLTPVFIPCHPSDQAFAHALNQRAPLTVLPPLQGGASQHLALLRECQVLWGSRLHALAFALMGGVPFAALAYDPKVAHFTGQVNASLRDALPCWPLAEIDAGALAAATDALLDDAPQLAPTLLQTATRLRRAARAGLQDAGDQLAGRLGLQRSRGTDKLG